MTRNRLLLGLVVAMLWPICLTPGAAQAEEWRTEDVYTVMAAHSLNNLYAGIKIPQNPGLAEDSWNSAHQDSYCSESVGLSGPGSDKLQVIRQFNPYGFTPCMACNSKNQMIGVAFSQTERVYRLIVFDADLRVLSVTKTADYVPGLFGGGYFFLDKDENTIVSGNNRLACYPTTHVASSNTVYELDPRWVSDDIVNMVAGSPEGNSLYSALPVWCDDDPYLYWCLIAGSYAATPPGTLISQAYIAVVRVVPKPEEASGCTTILLDAMPLPGQWNNNTFAVDEDGAYLVTNALDENGVCNDGYLHAVEFDREPGSVSLRWSYRYENSGYLKPGMGNIGSGTTPTLLNDQYGNHLVAIGDNAYPQMHVVVVDRDDGSLVAKVPVLPKMRGADEASLIGVGNRLVAENNFGHVWTPMYSQYAANEPGMVMIDVDTNRLSHAGEIIWEDNRTCFLGMAMLCRESGIIFAATVDWHDASSATEGGMYYISAIDSWDGRTIWRIPLGRGRSYAHEYGGVYFDREGSVYVGTLQHLITIKNYRK